MVVVSIGVVFSAAHGVAAWINCIIVCVVPVVCVGVVVRAGPVVGGAIVPPASFGQGVRSGEGKDGSHQQAQHGYHGYL